MATTANSHGPRPAPRHLWSYVAPSQLYSDHYPGYENRPDGIISIAFSRSTIRNVHTNNDPIRGVVHVKSNIRVKSVSVQFVGRTICRAFEGASQQVSSTELFRHGLVLQQATFPSATCPPNRIEYPFEFRFPEAVQLPPSSPLPTDPKFEGEAGHTLPPSLWWNESTVRSEYVLEAQFVSEERHFTMNPKVVHQLRFFPSVPEVGLPEQIILRPGPPVRVERRSGLNQSGLGKGTLHRLTRRISGSTENLDESLGSDLMILSAPEHYRVGSTSPLKITLQSAANTNGNNSAPLFLRGIRAQAVARIDYRIPLPSHPSLVYNLLRSGESKFDLFNRRYAIPGLALDASTPTDIEAFEINKLVPPTFRTYNIALKYDVKYDMLLECGGKESEHSIVVRDVRIEPTTRPGGWLGPPPDDGVHEEGALLADLMRENVVGRSSDGAQVVIGGVHPPAYEP
ncbi:hypothetical protein E8E13_010908 [Curvularia kusanoi]|uniref:Arrestin-like N-terminal domain-containing protein n=1 Tax=Curvularia kusanoi TaxID=90978 RepID=A0A9P4TNT0_CURKU|nr:hypothetical protein E8E13_010908 [Curvularia kusanoi]